MANNKDISELLAAFASCTDYTSYWHTLRAVENQLNYLENNGRAGEAMDARPEFERINRVKGRMVNAQFAAIPTFSAAELIARANPQPSHKAA